MAKTGRKRKVGVREPNGRLQRPSKEEREAARLRREAGERATVLAQPHRRGNYDQLCASSLGRHVLDHRLRRELYDAGEEYAETVRRWRAAKGVPVGLSAIGVGSGRDMADEAVKRLGIRLNAMRQAVTTDGGPQALIALDRVALDQETLPGAIGFRVTGALITLATHLGLIARDAHPYRAGPT
jgi:hypothetical protein